VVSADGSAGGGQGDYVGKHPLRLRFLALLALLALLTTARELSRMIYFLDFSSCGAVYVAALRAEVGTVFQSYYGGIPSARGVDEIYFMGIIDILQLYNLNKQTETFYKGLFGDK
jgi:hypothetical protein